jgi:hypothetical protein
MSSFFIWSTASIRLVLELDDESALTWQKRFAFLIPTFNNCWIAPGSCETPLLKPKKKPGASRVFA